MNDVERAPHRTGFKFSLRTLLIAVALLSVIIAVAMRSFESWLDFKRTPNSVYLDGSQYHNREFFYIGYRGFGNNMDEMFYAISVGCVAFDPNIPSLSYNYSRNQETGGTLHVDGKKIEYSHQPRLLALNPFGEMEELNLTPAEAGIVSTRDGDKIWEKVVLKRLYRRSGTFVQGKMTGRWTCSDAAGRLAYEGSYVDGQRAGKWTYYYRSGKRRAEISYDDDGDQHGLWTWYDQEGGVTKTVEWEDGYPVDQAMSWSLLGLGQTYSPNKSSVMTSK